MIGNAIKHFVMCILGFEKPHSQTTHAEPECIKKFAQYSKIAIEIGVYEGVNTTIIAKKFTARI